jgi:peptidoglycan/xylan/chitin deacetylase (PgdA/CDA1 family)
VLRVVNYHSVPRRFAQRFEEQVHELARTWRFASPAELPALLQQGVEQPTLLVCFDDGLANTIEHAAPILEAAGGRAIFAVPAAWPDVPAEDRRSWFQHHVYPTPTELHELDDDIEAPTWEELKAVVARGHEIWSHGVEHVQLVETTPTAVLEQEIAESKEILERQLGTTVRGYCPPVGYSVPLRALAMIADTYELAFGGRPARAPVEGDPFRIPRSNVEASWPSSAVRLQLSPLGDALSRVLEGVRS